MGNKDSDIYIYVYEDYRVECDLAFKRPKQASGGAYFAAPMSGDAT